MGLGCTNLRWHAAVAATASYCSDDNRKFTEESDAFSMGDEELLRGTTSASCFGIEQGNGEVRQWMLSPGAKSTTSEACLHQRAWCIAICEAIINRGSTVVRVHNWTEFQCRLVKSLIQYDPL